MLGNCTDLYECEKTLSASLDNIKYLGEVDFSFEDIDKLSALIKEKIDEEKNLGFLKGVPACLSFYLVGKGILNYYSGEFWPQVLEELGIAGERSQNVLGEIFLNFLQSRGFSHVHTKRALPYVAPILLHGGIPLSCLKEFYEKIIKHLLNRGMVDESNIRNEICRIRKIEERREALLDEKDGLFERINTLGQEIGHLKNIIELFRKREELQEKTADQEAWADLPDYYCFIETSKSQQQAISRRIEKLSEEKAGYHKKISENQRFLDFKEEIEKLVQEFDSYQSGQEKISVLKDEAKGCEDELDSLAAHLWQWEEGEQSGEDSWGTQKITGILRGFLASELARLSTARESPLSLDIDKFAALVREQPSLDSLVASGKGFAVRFKKLQTHCREHRRDEQELAQLTQEIAEWEAALEQVAAAIGQKLQELAEVIEKIGHDLPLYQKRKKQQELLKIKIKELKEKIENLALDLLPGGWNEKYRDIICRVDITEVTRELKRIMQIDSLCDETIETLEKTKNKIARAGVVVWGGGTLVPAGLILVLTVQNSIGYLILLSGFVLVAVGYGCFKKNKKQIKILEQKWQQDKNNLDGSIKRLTEALKALPVCLESLIASGEAWVGRFEALQAVCREHRRDEQELAQLKQEMAEWETALEQVAVSLPDPIPGQLEKKIKELKERMIQAKVRKEEADAARETLENEISPAINDAEKRRVQFEQEISALEQRLGELGPGLREIDLEIKRLKEREAECLKQVESFTGIDQKLLELAEVIKKIEQSLPFYQEQQNRHQILKAKTDKHREEIKVLISKLWPEGGERICSTSARVELRDFIKHVSSEKIDHLLNMWVEDLKRLHTAHRKYRQYIDKLLSLEKEAKDWEENFKRIITALSFPPVETLEGTVAGLANHLKQTEERKKEFEAARAALEKEVHEARSHMIQIEQEVAVLKQKIRELGKGDLEAGARKLEEKKQALKELKETEKKLEQHVAALPHPVNNLQEALSLKEGKNQELDTKRVDLSRVEEQLANYVSPFEYADEPVRRFVIYGGEWTIKWLCTCTALHRHYLGEVIPLPEGLPARVVAELEKLIREEIEIRKNVPKIILDHGRGDLKMVIGGHRFHIYDVTSPSEIYVSIASGEVPPTWTKEIRLRAYLKNGIVEIPEDWVNLPHISSEYLVTLYIGDISYLWRVKAWDSMPYMIFNEKGKKIKPDQLTKQRVWLFFPESYELYPENAIISDSDACFEDNRYRFALVNFVLEPVINLVSKEGSIYEIAPAGVPVEPFLSSESSIEIAVGAWAEGKRPIYTRYAPRLCIPVNNDEEIKEWTIWISKTFTDGTDKKLVDEQTVSDLGNFGEKYFEIDLNSEGLLGPHPLGEYSIILSRQEISKYSFELVIFPDLMLFFEPEIYFPRDAEGGEAKLVMVIPENINDVQVKEPARIVEKDGDEVRIGVVLERDELQAELLYFFEGRQCRTLITVEIPKLHWRLREAEKADLQEWSQYVKEVWQKDCCGLNDPKLEIMLPGYLNDYDGRLRVYLEGTSHQLIVKAGRRFLQFALSGLADTLRLLRLKSGQETCSLRLALEDSRGRIKADGKLFDIRCRWRIENFRYTVEESAGERCLKAAWLDRGEQQDRVLRLWRLWEPWVEPLVLAVPDGVSELEIRRNAAEFLPGPYMIKFDIDDSWGEGLADEFPTERSNSEQIFIKNAGIHISISECYWVNKRKLRISGKLANTAGRKEISVRLYGVVEGRYKVWPAVTSTNENGHFSFEFENPFEQFIPKNGRISYPAKEIARPHWLGVIAEDNAYHFQILPELGGLWWPLALALEGAFSDLDEDGGGQIYIDCREERLDEPLLNKEISKNVLRDFRQGKEKSPVDIQIGGKIKKAYLWRDKIELKTKAVKCTSGNCPFGKSVEPDQQAWDNKHFPAGCKSFIVNFREISTSLSWYLDLTLRIRNGQEKYQLAGNHLLTLYNNLTRPLPEPVRLDEQNPEFDLEKLIAALWEREKILLSAWGGVNKSEHQPH